MPRPGGGPTVAARPSLLLRSAATASVAAAALLAVPTASGQGETECKDSDGKVGPGVQGLVTVSSARPAATVVPIGAATFKPPAAVLDSPKWKALLR